MKRLIAIILFGLSAWHIHGQFIEVGGSLGGATYQGDISHFSSKFSMQGARFLNSVHVGYHFKDYYSVKFKFSNGSIGAYDSESASTSRRKRNLHFRSDIQEFALVNEFELLDIFHFFKKINIKPFFNFGIAYFSFNPEAKYKGNWVDLQPLSTEGQGLPGSELRPYSLHQWSIPFGFGLKYYFNDGLYLGFEISPRITFTDFLDDVSGNYPDMDILRSFKGEMATQLSYRGDQLPGGGGEAFTPENIGRGNPKDNDWYIFNTFVVGYKFDPVKAIKRRKSFSKGRKCNFFN
jgi:hypothetical protein